MSVHIGGKAGDIAETVLLPGDPLRAKFIADNFMEDVTCYTEVRGMLGFTGTFQGKRVSVQGTGMGMASHSIYVHELINEYGCKNLIRVGSCGSIRDDINLRDVILAQAASTDSGMFQNLCGGFRFAPIADFELLNKAYNSAVKNGLSVKVGNILSSDNFYNEPEDSWKMWKKLGVMAIEMEAAALYTLGAKFGVNTLCILTVSDHIEKGELLSSEERQTSFKDMMELGLSLA